MSSVGVGGYYGWRGMRVATAAWRSHGQGRHGVRSSTRQRSAMVTVHCQEHEGPDAARRQTRS